MRLLSTAIMILAFTFVVNAQLIDDVELGYPDGGTTSIVKEAGKEFVVLMFVSVNCPYSKYYKNRIEGLVAEYQSKVSFLLINSNVSEFGMKNPFKAGIPYFYDQNQKVASAFSARKCPEAFLLKKISGKFEVQYSGALDDSPQLESDVQTRYLANAIDDVLSGYVVDTKTTRPTGCMIRIH